MINTLQWLGVIIITLNLLPFILKKPKLITLTGIISLILIGLKMGGFY